MVEMSSEASNDEYPSTEGYVSSNRELADQVINKFAGKAASKTSNKRPAPISKDDEEYQKKRERNNVAVKKSREKAKNRIQETQHRVEQLSKENEDLQNKVSLLSKELNVLRALFTNGGFTLPELQYVDNSTGSPSEHSPSVSYSPHSRLSSEESVLSPSLHPYELEKSHHFHEDSKGPSKIPPLRPTPRIPSTSPNQHIHHPSSIHSSSMSKNYPGRMYQAHIVSKSDFVQKDSKHPVSGPPLLIQTGHENSLHNTQQGKGDTRHPSVIRSTTDVKGPKICRIQDIDRDLKIAPINS